MLADLLTWVLIATVAVAALRVLALPKHWYRSAQYLFALATALADVKIIHWAITSSYGRGSRLVWLSVGLAATSIFAFWSIRKVQKDIREHVAANKALDAVASYQRTLISNWRGMIIATERAYKSGQE